MLSEVIAPTTQPVVSASSAYTANDAVGGLLTFASAAIDGFNSGIIDGLLIIDDAAQAAELDLVLFSATFTATADNAAWNVAEASMENCIGHITLTDYAAGSANAVGTKSGVGIPFNLGAGNTTIYGQLVTRGTPTYAATDDLTVKLLLRKDFGR